MLSSVLRVFGGLMALACAAGAQPAMAAGDGSLKQLKGTSGCVSAKGKPACTRGRALDGADSLAVSPGGGSVYAASQGSDAVAVFRRADRTGALRQLKGRAGCVSLAGRHGCGRARALRDPSSILVSPDGRNVYVGSWPGRAILTFARNRRTDQLRQLRGSAGCVSGRRSGSCRRGRALGFVSGLTLSPGGRLPVRRHIGGARRLSPQRAHRPAGPTARRRRCITAEAREGCARGHAFGGVTDVATDRGGHSLYTAGGSVGIFNLAGGVPHQLAGTAGCISDYADGGCTPARSLLGVNALGVSPGGAQVYATAEFSAAVGILTRDRATGALSQRPGPLGCIRDGGTLGCADARFLDHPSEFELSHDGRNAYVAGVGKLVVLRRDSTTGALSQLPGRAGCIARRTTYPGCTDNRGVNALRIGFSRDGRSAYLSDREADAIAIYRRAR